MDEEHTSTVCSNANQGEIEVGEVDGGPDQSQTLFYQGRQDVSRSSDFDLTLALHPRSSRFSSTLHLPFSTPSNPDSKARNVPKLLESLPDKSFLVEKREGNGREKGLLGTSVSSRVVFLEQQSFQPTSICSPHLLFDRAHHAFQVPTHLFIFKKRKRIIRALLFCKSFSSGRLGLAICQLDESAHNPTSGPDPALSSES
ncbi:hypothetical protein IE53DRAFT_16330 [Violaceomyces palustris]|uniref:Uncharacterized protein n=1 Tax=Violaceomyces palustris TaxID=1673888 RepID=A0ACD0P250_9BASI|nr:hypothetical protein IE53DRAFT_16330 [Violaceomyces palustris]